MTYISKTQNAKKDEIYCMSIVLQKKKKNDDSDASWGGGREVVHE